MLDQFLWGHLSCVCDIYYIGFYAYAMIVPSWADQLLPQLLMEQLDTLPLQCRHIEHMHEGVWLKKKQITRIHL